jgi:23S rRNA maturation-related 3'-5' exoribonuclease YhaM
MKSDILSNEINLIQDKNIKEFTINTLENAPDYFYRAMASSTGKYHPQCTCKVGGLITHVKRATYLANRLCDGYGIKNIDRDIILSAIILHDIAKVPSPKEDPKITYADYENHPINAEKYFIDIPKSDVIKKEYNIEAYKPEYGIIRDCIRYHMGLWTPQSIKKDLKEYTLLELIVYTADYIAATKDLITPKDGE